MAKQLSIHIVGWNSAQELMPGLTELAKISPADVDILFIDNASSDTSRELVKKILPAARLLVLPHNTGFAHAHNVGIAQCRTPFVLLHNPDVVIRWPAIVELLQYFSNPTLAAAQGKLLRPGTAGAPEFDSAGITLTLAYNGHERGASQLDTGQYDTPSQVAAVTGACSLYRVAAVRAVAHGATEFFDEDFFAYKEDVDLGWRLTRAGWQVMYYPIVMGTHERTLRREGFANWGVTPARVLQRLRSPRTRYSFRNWLWMILKNAPLSQLLLHEIFIDARAIVFLVLSVVHPPLFTVWREIFNKLPHMLTKRAQVHRLAQAAVQREQTAT